MDGIEIIDGILILSQAASAWCDDVVLVQAALLLAASTLVYCLLCRK